ncbi:spheroidene monooxygenase [Pontibacter fetidus]|uniref:Spheroidene monooxygenase n=1 Tax=Pontibacter fetidus TaxID=2700082 RepID=A0A6B2GX82_9BACT|nr:spheroidene monooxygenase [Pontibacter fetidus]NDK54468.1 spheroidene monooxygenase [Pontibacter fetidus]
MQPTIAPTSTLTTLTLFGIKNGHMRWGLAQMGTSGPELQKVPGLVFYKLLGSGHGKGFSIKPNFYRYGLICTWQSEQAATDFFERSELMHEYRQHSFEQWTCYLQPLQSHGQWDKKEPFTPVSDLTYSSGPMAVITRASINWRALPSFWKYVPQSSKALDKAEGLLCSIGMGELPLIRQATFSIWNSAEAMKTYAYRNPKHLEVIKRTRAENWYSEELFARFIVVKTVGTWNGIDPVSSNVAG